MAIAVIAPATILEAVVGVGIPGIPAKAARCTATMLRIRVVFPAPIFQGMILFCGGAHVGITDAAVLFYGVLCIVIFIVFRAGAMTAVLIFSATTAVIASAVAPVLAGRVVFPIAVRVRTVGSAPVNGFATITADFLPVTSIPRRVGVVMLARGIFLIATFCADTSGIKAMGFCMAIRILVCGTICAALPGVMLGFVFLLIVISK